MSTRPRTETRTHDTQGRPYARLSELRAGDRVVLDDGFDCMDGWEEQALLEDNLGLHVTCELERHYIDAQLEPDGDTLVGIYRAGTMT